MLTGILKRLVHLSQQQFLPNTRLAPDHNDKIYGIIEDADGREVYFSHEVVEHKHGFDNLRRGQQLEYALENAPYLLAALVKVASVAPSRVLRAAA